MNVHPKLPLVAAMLLALISPTVVDAMELVLDAEVRLPAGAIRGADRDKAGILAFKGIASAASPIGPRRWHAPQPVWPREGVRKADHSGDRCLSAWTEDRETGPPRV